MYSKNLNETNAMTNTTAAGETAKRIRTHLGARGTVTGRMRWNPLVYPCRDGSVTFLFQVDAIPGSKGPDGRQTQEPLRMRCHLPADFVQFTPFVWLRQGHMVTVRYVVRTDYYRNAAGQPASSTYLDVEEVVREEENEQGTIRPKGGSCGAATHGVQDGDRRRENWPNRSGHPNQRKDSWNAGGTKPTEGPRGTRFPGGRSYNDRRSFGSPAGRPAGSGQVCTGNAAI